jgi:hypothetical protein
MLPIPHRASAVSRNIRPAIASVTTLHLSHSHREDTLSLLSGCDFGFMTSRNNCLDRE